ncbi:MAG: hypothetical protein ACI9H8_002108 [Lysobacterales bacterium]|jgi:hypothetical protein
MVRLSFSSLVAVLLLAICSSQVSAADVKATLDRVQIVAGETVTLVLETNDPQQSLSADFTILAENFEILDQRSETQMSIANGRQVAVVRLMLTLEPKRTGILTIPALKLPGATTRPMQVEVEAAPELEPGEMPPVFIEMALDPEQGPYYVHAQLALTVRIFYQQNLTEAAINPPTPQQASVRLLDEVPFQSTRNGIRYRVLERRYAIFPERSGELEIPPLTLSGRLIERPADRLWQPSVRGRRVTVESDPITVIVMPKPADYAGEHWLPARRITLSQQISDTTNLHVGEPVTRTVILDAVGLEENMIEEPGWPEMKNVRVYPDQPQGISRDDGQWILGHKEFRYAVVPEKAGELVLPEIHLNWWDTTNNQLQTAILPEHRIEVLASDLVTNASSQGDTATATVFPPTAGFDPSMASDLQRWRMFTLGFAILWLITLVMLLRAGRRVKPDKNTDNHVSIDEENLLLQLKNACKDNNASQVRNVFGTWVRRFGPANANGSIMDFARQVGNEELRSAIELFDAGEFSAQRNQTWQAGEFWKAFSNWKQPGKRPVSGPDSDPDLYH